MFTFLTEPKILRRYEKDDPQNTTGLQLVVFSLCNGTIILTRAYIHKPDAHKEKLWDGKTNGQVDELVLNMLLSEGHIKKAENWEYSIDAKKKFAEHNPQDDLKLYIYFAWKVHDHLLLF